MVPVTMPRPITERRYNDSHTITRKRGGEREGVGE